MADPGQLVYRPVTGRVFVAGYVAFAAWWVISALTGSGLSWTAGAWLLTGVVVLYALFWRPAVVVGSDAVRLVNIVREVRVPWACLEGIQTRFVLTLTADGRDYASWAASAPGRRRTAGLLAGQSRGSTAAVAAESATLPRRGWLQEGHAPDRSSRDLGSDSGAAAFMVEQAWIGWRHGAPASAAPVGSVGSVGSQSAAAAGAGHGGDGAGGAEVRWNAPLLVALIVLPLLAALATGLHL
ncbi:MAG TPA: PH domain-containing protein [Kineosporiaceae bacterium]|nr:PH domain-containing protein [Kineosporiaceae bacterium]